MTTAPFSNRTAFEAQRAAATARFFARQKRQHDAVPPLPRALNEECGVFGIIGYEAGPAAPMVALGLHALQHRGQEACGVITHDPMRGFNSKRALGLVSQTFQDEAAFDTLPGNAGIGHTRYSTTGGGGLLNVQPFVAELDTGTMAFAHNGNLTNAQTLRRELIKGGRIFHTTSDSELFLKLTALSPAETIPERLVDNLHQVEGAYALVALTDDVMIGVRDPVGIRPLVLGKVGNAHILASESCAIDAVGGTFVRDIQPGEMVTCHRDGRVESRQCFPPPSHARPCIFEIIYFARTNSIVDGESVYTSRKRLGVQLAEEHPIDADVICPVPDGGIAAALGYSATLGIPYEMGLIRGHYGQRTFIQPSQAQRERGVNLKLSANAAVVEGKRVVLIDDSLVRGTTSKAITRMLLTAGAKEVHFRIASPPIKYPDFYGIDTPNRSELKSAQYSPEQISQQIGADSFAFLSIDGLYRALGKQRRADLPAFTDHCFTGQYPTALADQEQRSRTGEAA